jgi:hypothetical protein
LEDETILFILVSAFSSSSFAQLIGRNNHFEIVKLGLERPELKDTSFTFLWFEEGPAYYDY